MAINDVLPLKAARRNAIANLKCFGALGTRDLISMVTLTFTMQRHLIRLAPEWGLDGQVGSAVRQSASSIPGGAKSWAQTEFVNIYQFRFHPMLKYAFVYYVRFVLSNLRHCGKPWRWLVAAYRPC